MIETNEILIDAYDVYDAINIDVTDEYAFTLFTHDVRVPFQSVTARRDANDTIVFTVTATREFFDAYARHFDIPDDERDEHIVPVV